MFKTQSQFMLSIGEAGVMLLYFKNDTLKKRYFIKNREWGAISDIKACLTSDKNAPLYFILNHKDQKYILQSIPSASRISACLSIKAKREHFTDHDINSTLLLEKPDKVNPYWHYIFILSRTKQLIEYWFSIIVEIGANFRGILMFPIEISCIARKVQMLCDNPNHWKIIVVATKTGGYRQVVIKENKILFSRLIPFTDDSCPGIVAGEIYQEVKNTTYSLTRFGFKRDDHVDLCIVVQEDIKSSLSAINFTESSVSIFTPYELSKLLGSDLAISEKDKFCDSVILFHSFKNKPRAVLNTKETRKFCLLNAFYLSSHRFFLFFAFILIIANTFCLFNLFVNIHKTERLIKKERLLEKQLIRLNQIYDEKEKEKINAFTEVKTLLSRMEYSPLAQVKYMEKLSIPQVELKSFAWNYDELKSSITTKLEFKFQLDENTSNNYQELQELLKKHFRTQTTSISNLFITNMQSAAAEVIIRENI